MSLPLYMQLAIVAGVVVLGAIPFLVVIAWRERQERRAAFRRAQADKILVPLLRQEFYRRHLK